MVVTREGFVLVRSEDIYGSHVWGRLLLSETMGICVPSTFGEETYCREKNLIIRGSVCTNDSKPK